MYDGCMTIWKDGLQGLKELALSRAVTCLAVAIGSSAKLEVSKQQDIS